MGVITFRPFSSKFTNNQRFKTALFIIDITIIKFLYRIGA